MTNKIEKTVTIEDLINDFPFTVTYLMKQGIRCIRCGEPIWGTLESASIEKGFSQSDIDNFVEEINYIIENPQTFNENTGVFQKIIVENL